MPQERIAEYVKDSPEMHTAHVYLHSTVIRNYLARSHASSNAHDIFKCATSGIMIMRNCRNVAMFALQSGWTDNACACMHVDLLLKLRGDDLREPSTQLLINILFLYTLKYLKCVYALA